MFIKKSSFGRAVLFTALVSFLSFGFISCQPETQIKEIEKTVEKTVEKEVYVFVDLLTKDDPICGYFDGHYNYFWISPDFISNGMASNVSEKELADEADKSPYTHIEFYGEDIYFEKDPAPVYVAYKTEDKKSGVLIYKAKHSAYGYPEVNTYYGLKFQFQDEGFNDVWIEAGMGIGSLNSISDLADALENITFNNTSYFSEANWKESASGVTRKTE